MCGNDSVSCNQLRDGGSIYLLMFPAYGWAAIWFWTAVDVLDDGIEKRWLKLSFSH
jgi:hypothetical protein